MLAAMGCYALGFLAIGAPAVGDDARQRNGEIEPQTEFIREGHAADGLYVLLTGRADVTANGVHLASLTTGDVAGEMSLLSSGVAEASVTSRSWVTALVLTYEIYGAFSDAFDARIVNGAFAAISAA